MHNSKIFIIIGLVLLILLVIILIWGGLTDWKFIPKSTPISQPIPQFGCPYLNKTSKDTWAPLTYLGQCLISDVDAFNSFKDSFYNSKDKQKILIATQIFEKAFVTHPSKFVTLDYQHKDHYNSNISLDFNSELPNFPYTLPKFTKSLRIFSSTMQKILNSKIIQTAWKKKVPNLPIPSLDCPNILLNIDLFLNSIIFNKLKMGSINDLNLVPNPDGSFNISGSISATITEIEADTVINISMEKNSNSCYWLQDGKNKDMIIPLKIDNITFNITFKAQINAGENPCARVLELNLNLTNIETQPIVFPPVNCSTNNCWNPTCPFLFPVGASGTCPITGFMSNTLVGIITSNAIWGPISQKLIPTINSTLQKTINNFASLQIFKTDLVYLINNVLIGSKLCHDPSLTDNKYILSYTEHVRHDSYYQSNPPHPVIGGGNQTAVGVFDGYILFKRTSITKATWGQFPDLQERMVEFRY